MGYQRRVHGEHFQTDFIMFFKAGLTAGFIAAASALPQGPAGSATTAKPSTASPFGTYSYPQEPSVNSAAVSSVASYAGIPASEIPGATNAVPPIVSSQVTGVTSHGPYSGTPTTTGALSNSPAGTAIPMLPPNPTATYSPDGTLHDQQQIPYTPAGGLGTNGISRPLRSSSTDTTRLVSSRGSSRTLSATIPVPRDLQERQRSSSRRQNRGRPTKISRRSWCRRPDCLCLVVSG